MNMNGVSDDPTSSPTLPAESLQSVQSADSSPPSHALDPGCTVFVLRTNGCLYLGTVREIEASTGRVLVEYQDGTSGWSLRRHIKKFVTNGGLRDDGNVIAKFKSLRVVHTKDDLPYDIDNLTWDSTHCFNANETYCYCGGPGSWKNMVQCRHCLQWFHRACLVMSDGLTGLLCDRWFLFVCNICNGGREYLRRLVINLGDFLHLALYNLHDKFKPTREVGFSMQRDLVGFLNRYKKAFKFHPKVLQALEDRPVETMRQTLGSTPMRFRNVSKKDASGEKAGAVDSQPSAAEQHAKYLEEEWALPGDYPPPGPRYVYPSALPGVVTDETLREALQPPEFRDIRNMLGFNLPGRIKKCGSTDGDDSSDEGSGRNRKKVKIERLSHEGDENAKENGAVGLEKASSDEGSGRNRKKVKIERLSHQGDENAKENGAVGLEEASSDEGLGRNRKKVKIERSPHQGDENAEGNGTVELEIGRKT